MVIPAEARKLQLSPHMVRLLVAMISGWNVRESAFTHSIWLTDGPGAVDVERHPRSSTILALLKRELVERHDIGSLTRKYRLTEEGRRIARLLRRNQ